MRTGLTALGNCPSRAKIQFVLCGKQAGSCLFCWERNLCVCFHFVSFSGTKLPLRKSITSVDVDVSGTAAER